MNESDFKIFKEKLKPIFRGYKRVNATMKQRLKEMGFSIVRQKNHYILQFSLNGKMIFLEIDKTPGDCRSGIKTIRDINRVFRENGLILGGI